MFKKFSRAAFGLSFLVLFGCSFFDTADKGTGSVSYVIDNALVRKVYGEMASVSAADDSGMAGVVPGEVRGGETGAGGDDVAGGMSVTGGETGAGGVRGAGAVPASGNRRSALDELNTAAFIDVALIGDFSQKQTAEVQEDTIIAFEAVPVGAKITAEAEIYYFSEAGQRVRLYEGRSEPFVVHSDDNEVSMVLKRASITEGDSPDGEDTSGISKDISIHIFVSNLVDDGGSGDAGNDGAGGSGGSVADGSREHPWATLALAIADIWERSDAQKTYTIEMSGTFTGAQVVEDDLATGEVIPAAGITITGLLNGGDGAAGGEVDGTASGGSDAGAAPEQAVLDGQFNSEINHFGTTLTVTTKVPVTLKNVMVTGGNQMGSDSSSTGGGLFIGEGADVTVDSGALITGNYALKGGGVYVDEGAVLRLSAGTVSLNATNDTGSASGGGVYSKGTVYMYGPAVIGNKDGEDVATVNYYSNRSPSGGGVTVAAGAFYLGYKNYVSENENETASTTGGIFYNFGGLSSGTTGTGGGVFVAQDALFVMAGGTVCKNAAREMGGGFDTATYGGTIIINGGEVRENGLIGNNDRYAAGFHIRQNAELYINGGSISANQGSGVAAEGTVIMTGGTVTENTRNGINLIYSTGMGKLTASGGSVFDNESSDVYTVAPITLEGSAKLGRVYFSSEPGLKISGEVTGSSPAASISFDGSLYEEGRGILQLAEGVTDAALLKTAAKRLGVTQESSTQQWYVEGGGTLSKPNFYVSGTGDDSASGLKLAEPLESVDKACELIIEAGQKDLDWTIYVNGDVTGPHEGTNQAGSRTYTKDFGMSTIPAALTLEHAKSILLTGSQKLPSDGVPLDKINRGLREVSSTSTSETGVALSVQTEVPVTIKNLKLTNGNNNSTNSSTETVNNNGGGLSVLSGSTVYLTDGVLISHNTAKNGGGVYNAGKLFISGSAVIGDVLNGDAAVTAPASGYTDGNCSNYGSSYGGGIYNAGKLYLGYSGENQETAWEGDLVWNFSPTGGGIYNTKDGEVILSSGTVKYNTHGNSGTGGGAVFNYGTFTMTGGSIDTNQSNGKHGAGVFNAYSSTNGAGIFNFAGGVIKGNKANFSYGDKSSGGGVYNAGIMYMYGDAVVGDDSAAEVASGSEDCSNFASCYGGGICVSGTNAKLYMGYSSYTSEAENTPVALNGGIYYNYVSYNGSVGGGGLAVQNSGTVVMNSGTIANNGALENGTGVYLGSNGFTIGGDADIFDEIWFYSSYSINIADSLSTFEDGALTITPSSDSGNTQYYATQPVIKLTEGAAAQGLALSDVIPKFTVTPLVSAETRQTTNWIIDESTGKMTIKTSSGTSASFDTGTADIVVYRNGYAFTPPISATLSSGTIMLNVKSVAGVDFNSSTMTLVWSFDGEVLNRDSLPEGVTFDSTTSDRQINIDSSKLAAAVYDVTVETTYNGEHYSFTTQIIMN